MSEIQARTISLAQEAAAAAAAFSQAEKIRRNRALACLSPELRELIRPFADAFASSGMCGGVCQIESRSSFQSCPTLAGFLRPLEEQWGVRISCQRGSVNGREVIGFSIRPA